MGIRELRAEASKLGIKNYSRMNKADLETAINAASTSKTVDNASTSNALVNAEFIGQVSGCMVFVSKSASDRDIGELLGSFSKGDARQVRKLMQAAGFTRFAALPRIVVANQAAKAA